MKLGNHPSNSFSDLVYQKKEHVSPINTAKAVQHDSSALDGVGIPMN